MTKKHYQIIAELGLLVSKSLYLDNIGELSFDNKVKEFLESLNVGIYQGANGFYEVVKETKYIPKHLKRLTNYTFYVTNSVKLKDFNHFENADFTYDLRFKVEDKSFNINFTYDELQNLRKFGNKISKKSTIASILDERQLQKLVATTISRIKQPEITEYKTAGLNYNAEEQLFVTANRYYKYGKQEKKLPKTIRLYENAILQPKFTPYKEITEDETLKEQVKQNYNITPKIVTQVLLMLFDMLDKAYNKQIEPYLIIAMGYMTLFLKQISNDFEGTPIIALYGEAASGKSNLLRLIASAFGLSKDVLHGGMDTTAGIIADLENYVNIPLLIDEVELNGIDDVKRLIKAVYGQTGRKKYSGKNHINTTLFFNTNNRFLYDLEYKNRCIEANFIQESFNPDEAEKFNRFQKYLSYVSQYIIEHIQYSDIKQMIKETEKSELLAGVSDLRIKRNLAIAVTGLKVLINVINLPEIINMQTYEERLKKYITNSLMAYDDDIEIFLTILKELIEKNIIKNYIDYKIKEDGVHVIVSKNGTLAMHYKEVFCRFYKGAKPLEIKDYQKLIMKNQVTANKVVYTAYMTAEHYSTGLGSLYGLFLPFKVFSSLAYLADVKAYAEFKKQKENIVF